MKFCPHCGAQNNDDAKFCGDCGKTFDLQVNQNQNNAQYQQTNYHAPESKNKWIAPILNLIFGFLLYFLSGIGQILYLRLYKRGLILGAVGLFITIIFAIISAYHDTLVVTLISLLLGGLLIVYSMIDAYLCANAMNEGRDLPLLFGVIDTESLTRTHVIAIIVICVVGLVAMVGAILMSPDTTATVQSTNAIEDLMDSNNPDLGAESTLKVNITYPGSWSASIGDADDSTHYEGTGNQIINIDKKDYDVVAAAVSKKDSGKDKLKVQLINNGRVVDKESTTKEYGMVSVSTTL